MSEIGRVIGIATRPEKRAPMELREQIEVTENRGIAEEFRHTDKRQITVMTREDWDAICEDLAAEIPWTFRRANFLIEGLAIAGVTDRTLEIGPVRIELKGVTHPCALMDSQRKGLTKAIAKDDRGGVYGRVLTGGTVSIGDPVRFIEES